MMVVIKSILKRLVGQPEFFTLVLLVIAFVACALLSDFFLDYKYLLDASSEYMEIGIMALAMTFVIIAGHIDLSTASTLALVACLSAVFHARLGLPMVMVIVIAPIIGSMLGVVNGVLVAFIGLPSFVVTLATMALYRGTAQILLGDHSLSVPEWFGGIDMAYVPSTVVPLPLVAFIVLAIALGILLQKTVLGRWVYAIGTNEQAAFFSGVPVKRVKIMVFALSGFMAGLAALIMCSRLYGARYDHAFGWELDVITTVVLGGVSIYGGRGTIIGPCLALFLIAVLKTGMGVTNIKDEKQLAIIGVLLVVAVVVSNVTRKLQKQ